MVAHSPEDRPRTPREVADALSALSATSSRPLAARSVAQRAALVIAAVLVFFAVATAGWRFVPWSMSRGSADTPAEATEAERLYREGLFLLSQRQEQQTRHAIKRFEKACALEPEFALAYTALADAYNLCGDYGWDLPADVLPKARAGGAAGGGTRRYAGRGALGVGAGVGVRLRVGACRGGVPPRLELQPHLPAAHHWYAWFLAQQGRFDDADEHIERARRLGPAEVIIANNVGKFRYLRRDWAAAVTQHKRALELSPDFRKAHRDLGLVYAEMGRLDDALAEIDQSKGLTADGRDCLSARAYAYARNGRPVEARALLAQIEPLAAKKPLAYEIAIVHAALGDHDRAFRWLTEAFRQRLMGRGAHPRRPAVWTACAATIASRRCSKPPASMSSETLSQQLVQPLTGVAQLSLPGEFLPNGIGILIGRRNGQNARTAATAHGPAAERRLLVEPHQVQPLAERLESRFEILRRRGRFRCRHGRPRSVWCYQGAFYHDPKRLAFGNTARGDENKPFATRRCERL